MENKWFRYAVLGIGGIIALLLLLLLLLLLRDDDGGDAADTTTTTVVETTTTDAETTTTAAETTTTMAESTTTSSTVPDDPPDAVTGVAVGTGGGSLEMMVTWSPSTAPDLGSYEVYYSENSGGAYGQVATIPAGTTSYLDFPRPEATVKPGNCYKVSAVDVGGHEGPQSAEACFQPGFFPAEIAPIHGGSAWGVYLVANSVPNYAAARTTAFDRLDDLGYLAFGEGELACDVDAAGALGLDLSTIAVSLYFASQSDAEEFGTAYFYQYGDMVVGVVEVTTFCLD